MNNIAKNLEEVYLNISRAAEKSGRNKEDIKLLGVSKTIAADAMEEAIELGLKEFGESRVQEMLPKMEKLADRAEFQMIGHLQSNKVRDIIDKVSLIHSLDRMSLAKEINKRAKQHDLISEVLVQVNISGEETKHGLKPEDVINFIEDINKYKHIKIKGLMTMAAHTDDEDLIRNSFRELRELAEKIESKNYENFENKYLSMGMTNDYEIAIEEGANIIRVGRAIFGDRNY